MRIAVVGNVAGVGARRTRALRAAGYDAHLFTSIYEPDAGQQLRGLGTAASLWTGGARAQWGMQSGFVSGLRRAAIAHGFLRLLLELARFDVVHVIGTLTAHGVGLHRPLVVEPAGVDAALIAPGPGLWPLMIRWSWRRANAILANNGETIRSAERLGLSPTFVPIPIGVGRFRGTERVPRDRLLVFHPTRHIWHPSWRRHKANDVLIRGFAQAVHEGLKADLVCIEQGEDVDASRELIESLGITTQVQWLPLLSEAELTTRYESADVVADQFQIGAFGQVSLEGLAAGAALLTDFREDINRTYGERPPYEQASTPDEVAAALWRLNEPEHRRTLGHRGRSFVERHHDPAVVVPRMHDLYTRARMRSGRT